MNVKDFEVYKRHDWFTQHMDTAAKELDAAMVFKWVAVKELKLSYYIGETLLITIYIYTHYGNLI